MILADKIINLRKKNGWSQEELAAQIGVSRQAVSKWEGAQSVPDMNKILLLSKVFNVSTDYLLKDEMGDNELAELAGSPQSIDYDSYDEARQVSMEEANLYLGLVEKASTRIALGVLLCILSPIPMLLMVAASADYAGLFRLSEETLGVLGVIILLVMVAGAVTIFISNGSRLSDFDYLEKEPLETAYGVSGMVRERKENFRDTHTHMMAAGIALCICSALPILAVAVIFGDAKNDAYYMAGTCATLFLIALGVYMIVMVSTIWDSYQKLLEEGDYAQAKKRARKSRLMQVYWPVVTAIYLLISFLTGAWATTWLIWPVAGVLSVAVEAFAGKK